MFYFQPLWQSRLMVCQCNVESLICLPTFILLCLWFFRFFFGDAKVVNGISVVFNPQIRSQLLPRVSYILFDYLFRGFCFLWLFLFLREVVQSQISTMMRKKALYIAHFLYNMLKIMLQIGGTELDSLGFRKTRSSGMVPHANCRASTSVWSSFLEPDLWHIFWQKLLT